MRKLAIAFALIGIPVALACEGEEGASGSHCNMPQTASTAALPEGGTKTTLTVEGMHCGSCADKVHAALMGVPGVTGAQVELTDGKANIAYDPAKTSPEKLAEVVTKAGFKATAPKS